MREKVGLILFTALLIVGTASAKSPKHDDFPMTLRVVSVDRVQEASEGTTYWVYQYHIVITSDASRSEAEGKEDGSYTVQWFHHLKGGGFQAMGEFYTMHHITAVSLRKGMTYLTKSVDHNHAFKVIVVNDNGKEATETFDVIGVD
jgi:hypothetical protein